MTDNKNETTLAWPRTCPRCGMVATKPSYPVDPDGSTIMCMKCGWAGAAHNTDPVESAQKIKLEAL